MPFRQCVRSECTIANFKTGQMFGPIEMNELSLRCDFESITGIIEINNNMDLAYVKGFRSLSIQRDTYWNTVSHKIVDFVLTRISQKPLPKKLNKVKINIGKVNKYSVQRLFQDMKNCRFITALYLRQNFLCDSSIVILCKQEFKFLQKMDLSRNDLGHLTLKCLSTKKFPYLYWINLSQNKITNKGIQYLAKTGWPSLRFLYLKQVYITNDGIRALVKGNWQNIECIVLTNNDLGNQAFVTLVRNRWTKLNYLEWKDKHCIGCRYINWNECCRLEEYDVNQKRFSVRVHPRSGIFVDQNCQVQLRTRANLIEYL